MTTTEKQQVAQTILEQLGGRRFAVITGAKMFVALDNGLQFDLKSGAKDGIRKVRILLDPSDTYTVEFYKHSLVSPLVPFVLVSRHEDIYNDSLQDMFEHATGLYTTLTARR